MIKWFVIIKILHHHLLDFRYSLCELLGYPYLDFHIEYSNKKLNKSNISNLIARRSNIYMMYKLNTHIT
jgi:hypothetical protein